MAEITKTETPPKRKPRLKPKRPTPGAEAWTAPTSLVSESKTKIAGDKLVPADIQAVSSSVYTYWIGLTSDCPCATLDAGGIKFPQMEDRVEPDPARGPDLRIPVIGKLHPLNEDQIRAIIEELPRLMIRKLQAKQAGPVTGYGVRIPTEAQVKEARKLKRMLPTYTAQRNDVPAARFMFAVLCPDQDNPTRGHHYPPSLEAIGLEWPDELE